MLIKTYSLRTHCLSCWTIHIYYKMIHGPYNVKSFSYVWKDHSAFNFKVKQTKERNTTSILRNLEEYSPESTASSLRRLEASETQLWKPRGFLQSYFNSSTNECFFEFLWTTKHNNNNNNTLAQRRKHRRYLLSTAKVSPSVYVIISIQTGK